MPCLHLRPEVFSSSNQNSGKADVYQRRGSKATVGEAQLQRP